MGIGFYFGVVATILMMAVPVSIMIFVIVNGIYQAIKNVINFFKNIRL